MIGKIVPRRLITPTRYSGECGNLVVIERWRYTTSHPRDMAEELIQAHAHEKVMPYLHLPVQSGSDRVLEVMNRKHTKDFYLDLIDRFRAARPDIAFSSDFIVGYPGETEDDFEETLSLVRRVKYAMAYSFKYSRRPGTPAAALEDQIPEAVKVARLARLQALLLEQQVAFNRSKVGTRQRILLSKKGRHPGQLIGRTPFLQSVYVIAPERLIGQSVDVDITGASQNSLTGVVVIEDEQLCA
ncbi:MAG: radical SAM protein [Rhizobiaceae bacterium]|nr:radical SAM protein [Rhizobiaceae bacterium]